MEKENIHTKMEIFMKECFQKEKDRDKEYINVQNSNLTQLFQNKNLVDKL